MSTSGQFNLFDTAVTHDVDAARARVRAMIDRLGAMAEPFWRHDMELYLEVGVFDRALKDVPRAEAPALLAEYDEHLNRLDAIWITAHPHETEPS